MAFNSSTSPLLTTVSVSGDPSYELEASQNLTASIAHGMIIADSGAGGTFEIQTTGNLQSLAELSTTGLIVMTNPGSSTGLVTAVVQGNDSILIDDGEAVGGSVEISVVPSTTLQLHQAQINNVDVHIPVNRFNFVNGDNTTFEGTANGVATDITCNVAGVALANAPVIITEADSSLTDATNLGALSTGIVYSTVASGISTVSTTTAPTMSGANITSSTIPVTSVVGTAVDLVSVQSISGAKTFTSNVTVPTLSVVSGTIDMNSHKIVEVTDPTDAQDAATKAYVDAQTGSAAQWAMFPALQDVDMDGFKVENLGTPTANTDAATKLYVDNSVTAGASAWSTYPATQDVDMDGFGLDNAGQSTIGGTTLGSTSVSTKFYAGYTGSDYKQEQITTQTTDATPFEFISIPLSASQSVVITGSVIGSSSTQSDTTGASFTIIGRRGSSGDVEIVSTPFVSCGASSTGIVNATVNTSTQSVVVQVTGLASTTYNWVSTYNYQKILTNA